MKTAGYVHRDVSAGNCLFYQSSGKLADLEYSKLYEDISVSEPKTVCVFEIPQALNWTPMYPQGTPDYMAVEYQSKDWFFLKKSTSDANDQGEMGPIHSTVLPTEVRQKPLFLVHFLHDVESLWWVYFWFIHFRMPRNATLKEEMFAKVKKRQDQYFSCDINGTSHRVLLITDVGDSSSLDEAGVVFTPLYPDKHSMLVGAPLAFLKLLRRAYKSVQQTKPPPGANGCWRLPRDVFEDGLYGEFEEMLQGLLGEDFMPYPVKYMGNGGEDSPLVDGVEVPSHSDDIPQDTFIAPTIAMPVVSKRGRDAADIDEAEANMAADETSQQPFTKKQKGHRSTLSWSKSK